MRDIEIIIIDDNSNDDSVEIIQKYMKKDKRIKLIQNKENRRILFCKSMAALNSKGKYIIEIDQDDMFIRNDAFNILYKETEKKKLDILHFNYKYVFNLFNQSKKKNFIKNKTAIEKQPKLKFTMFKINNCLLWGNLILSELYKKIIYNLWPIIINYKIIFQEDYLITFFLLIYAQKYENISDILLYIYKNKKSISNGFRNNTEYYLSLIFAGIIFYD